MFGFKLLGNTKVPHRKSTEGIRAVRMTPPKEVLLPVAQHIGAAAVPVVKAGDEVKVGQLIAEASGAMSAHLYSSVSGKVLKIEPYLCPRGNTIDAIRIESDGHMTPVDGLSPVEVSSLDDYIDAVRVSGVVGLGGAGFPTALKLAAVKDGGIDKIVFNGAECEPYVTCDTRAMIDEIDLLVEGVKMLRRFVLPEGEFIFGIENNKPESIRVISEALADCDYVTVKQLPSLYPQGAEKVMIYNTTGRIVPEGKLPASVGVLVMNVSTVIAITKYIKTGMPLVERMITVDGPAVKNPTNVIAPLGTPVGEVIEFTGGLKDNLGKLLSGGPMMGIALRSLEEPVVKTMGGLVALSKEESRVAEPTACIHCGRCITACPLSLDPTAFSRALENRSEDERIDILESEKVKLCMECGCCSYVCPAKRPLIENNRIGKAELKEYYRHHATLKD